MLSRAVYYSVKFRTDFSVLHLIVLEYKLKHGSPVCICVDTGMVMCGCMFHTPMHVYCVPAYSPVPILLSFMPRNG